jgi:hypothetical protein
VPSVHVWFWKPSRSVRRDHTCTINRDRTFAGYARLRAATTKTAELSDVGALVHMYDALGDDIQYVESCCTSYVSLPRAVQPFIDYVRT